MYGVDDINSKKKLIKEKENIFRLIICETNIILKKVKLVPIIFFKLSFCIADSILLYIG